MPEAPYSCNHVVISCAIAAMQACSLLTSFAPMTLPSPMFCGISESDCGRRTLRPTAQTAWIA